MTLLTDIEGYWKCDTSGSFPDSVGSNDGTVSGATYTSSGKINGGYDFDGTNDKIVISGQGSLTKFTMNLRIYPHAVTGIYSLIVNNWANTNAMLLDISSSVIRAYIKNSLGDQYGSSTIHGVAVNTRYMITMVYDGSNIIVYKNGASPDSTAATGTVVLSADTRIGVYTTDLAYFDGIMDEIGIRDRDLTAAEIAELYNSSAGLQYPFSDVVANAIWFGMNF